MTEIRRDFHQQLDDVQRDMVRVAARVIDSIMRGTHALLDHDLVTAQAAIDGDDELDALTIELEERLFMMLALPQPVARDLRSIVAAIRMTSEIERSGRSEERREGEECVWTCRPRGGASLDKKKKK